MPFEEDRDSAGMSEATAKSIGEAFCTLDERRNSTRFWRNDGTDFAIVWIVAGEEMLAEVHDESLSGLGVLVDEPFDLRPGAEIQVVYAGEYFQGELRHITRQADGRFLMGLACKRLNADGVE